MRLAEHQLVEGDVARGRPDDLLNSSSHRDLLRDGRPRDSLSTSNPSRNSGPPLTLFFRRSQEHTTKLQPIMRFTYAVFSLKQKSLTKTISYDRTNLPPRHT